MTFYTDPNYLKMKMYQSIKKCPFQQYPSHVVRLACDTGYVAVGSARYVDPDQCFVGERNGRLYHIFPELQVSRASDGSIIDGIFQNAPGDYTPYFLENGSCFFEMDITNKDEYLFATHLSPIDMFQQLSDIKTSYFEKIHVKLQRMVESSDVEKREIFLPPHDLFDCLIDMSRQRSSNTIYPMKAVKLLPPYINFYSELRDVIFRLVHKYTEDNLKSLLADKSLTVKQRGTCSIEKMFKLPMFNCNNQFCNKADFIRKSESSTLPPLAPGMTICRHMLEVAADKYENDSFASWGFECQFSHNTIAPTAIQRAFTAIFGRKEPMHRSCVPAKYIDEKWMKWLFNRSNK